MTKLKENQKGDIDIVSYSCGLPTATISFVYPPFSKDENR